MRMREYEVIELLCHNIEGFAKIEDISRQQRTTLR